MKFVSRTLTALACATGLAFALPAMAVEKINIGVVTGPTFVHTVAAQKFKEEVDKALPGKYDVVVHHSAALGSETQVLQQLQLGTVQMSVCTTGPIEAFVPEIKALELPFLFSSYEATDKVLDGPVGLDLLKRFDKAGLVGMHFLDNGFRNVTNSKRPVQGPDDLKGMKIRTMESPTHLAIWRAIGANPTPMAWPITTQLQQGVLDGQENPISVISAGKLNEAGQKYLSLTRHVYSALVFVGSKAFMDKLPAADRKVFMDAAATASIAGRKFVRNNEASQLAALKVAGMQVVENPDLAAFRAKTEPVYASLSGDTKKIVEEIRKTVK
nr:DctP family TRAP transporter solute-binding subunit [uncultured Rhodoferax sp.]